MKIGIDIRPLIGGHHSGVEEYLLELLEHLFAIDRENHYVLFWNAWKLPPCPRDWDTRFPNVRLVSFRIPNKLLNLSLWYFGFPKIDRLVGGVDVFFMPNLNFSAFSRKTRVVVTAHDLSFERYPETFSWKRRLWHMLVNFRALIRRAHRVIAVSDSTRDDLVSRLGTNPRKINVIPSGISERFVRMSRNDPALLDVKRRYRLPYRFFLFVGTIEPRKNVIAIAEAFDALVSAGECTGYSLVIAGVHGWKWRGIRREIRQLSSRSTIRFLGFVRDHDRPALYNLSSVFVSPSLYEGFGFPALEAALCGVPVLVSHGSSFPETLGGGSIAVDHFRSNELFQAMRELVRDGTLATRFSTEGEILARRFTWEKAAKETLRTFERVMRRSSRHCF